MNLTHEETFEGVVTTLTEGGDVWEFFHPDDCESLAQAEVLFDGNPVSNAAEFVELCLHVQQQLGGKLTLNGAEI